jgi:carboxymethylenebutenolidase
LRAKGKNATFHVYPGTQHAFFNDTRPEVYDAAVAKTAWDRTLALFRANL